MYPEKRISHFFASSSKSLSAAAVNHVRTGSTAALGTSQATAVPNVVNGAETPYFSCIWRESGKDLPVAAKTCRSILPGPLAMFGNGALTRFGHWGNDVPA
ncbi:hypothetical protein [Sphingomonas sp. Root710]|uniref:hypothetical protein n=1 Tax=Sphingomonas sp. Root710 TaxID=1736594 RepID=UPI00138F2576|nr:hypothetical protein [Sphingomonas sp. Root710]